MERNNQLLDRLYNKFERAFDSVETIEYSKELLIADPNHQWGLAPMHYIPEFYANALNVLRHTPMT